jgi:hypothetical protein
MQLPSFPSFFLSSIVTLLLLSGGCEPDTRAAARTLEQAGIENPSFGSRAFMGCPENHKVNVRFSGTRENSRGDTIQVEGIVCCTLYNSCIVVYE